MLLNAYFCIDINELVEVWILRGLLLFSTELLLVMIGHWHWKGILRGRLQEVWRWLVWIRNSTVRVIKGLYHMLWVLRSQSLGLVIELWCLLTAKQLSYKWSHVHIMRRAIRDKFLRIFVPTILKLKRIQLKLPRFFYLLTGYLWCFTTKTIVVQSIFTFYFNLQGLSVNLSCSLETWGHLILLQTVSLDKVTIVLISFHDQLNQVLGVHWALIIDGFNIVVSLKDATLLRVPLRPLNLFE
jgi:hypothetical protein